MTDDRPGVLGRFMRFTTRREPVLSASLLAALALYLLDRYLGLTDDDLELIGMLMVPIVGGLVARLRAWAPESVERETDSAYELGVQDAGARLLEPQPRADSHVITTDDRR